MKKLDSTFVKASILGLSVYEARNLFRLLTIMLLYFLRVVFVVGLHYS